RRIAKLSPETSEINVQLKELLVRRAYSCSPLVENRNMAVQKMRAVFEFLVKHPERVSPGYREHLGDTPAHRVICDYLAGMTDAYLLRVYAELFG
ncbi:MAG: hypothetical protein JO210_04695, partial [Acidobacteriaceae bacterium]|nr:hypothetical protein [Acidobacteriaceae bacterium]